ncbi:MAG: hypothetical protein ISP49_14035 [Reyranella sp.]|nr:hypothetical protein [Reyranella sp.]
MTLFALTALLGAGSAERAAAQSTAALKARCQQLIAYYDRYGVGRSTNSDGRRNHTRIGAEIDCSRGLCAEGIATMENLLRAKKFTPPPPGPDEPEDNV